MAEIRSKKPRLLGARIAGLRLTPEERLVMARIDGSLTVDELVQATGLPGEKLEQVVSKLALDGAVDFAEPSPMADLALALDDGSTTSLAELAAAVGMDPSAFGGIPAASPPQGSPSPEPPKPSSLRRYTPVAVPQVGPVVQKRVESSESESEHEHEHEESVPAESEAKLEAAKVAEAEAESDEERREREKGERDEESHAIAERDYRQVFELRWHPLQTDQRVAAAKDAAGADLLALCFDPEPRVIASVLENSATGLDHARLIALHHRTGTGLEALARRREWLRDGLVERRLLRNPMIGDVVLGRVMAPKRLLATYKVAVDREIPDLTRAKGRGHLRQKWGTAAPEDRAELLLRTEARCLILMTGCTFDAKTTAILCGRPINSVMFVQSVAKFAGSPPALLAHLYKQPFVRKNPSIRKMLLAHPNMPGDIKRS